MYVNQIFEISMVLDRDEFDEIFYRVLDEKGYLDQTEDGHIDQSLASKGIIVNFRNSRYKKRVSLIINIGVMMDCHKFNSDKLIRKLKKSISGYFGQKYHMDDFRLCGMTIISDINVHTRKSVLEYLKVLKRIGKVKGFSPSAYEGIDERSSFCLDGNSNGINLLIYDLQQVTVDWNKKNDINRKKAKQMIEEMEGILRAEVRLTNPKAIRSYTDSISLVEQIKDLIKKNEKIFMDTFVRVVPFGAYYKKGRAEEIIRSEVEDIRLRRKMLQLLALIPEKKSLYLAQKAMNCRNIERVLDGFAKINLSPVTISKRQEIKHLKCIYEYLVDYI